MNDHSILIISGTNRPISNTLRVARIVQRHYDQAGIHATLLSLADLPLAIYSAEAYVTKPPEFADIQHRVLSAGGLHLVLPEYNGSFPGVLKHFIDMLKFPESLDHKPMAFVGLANGQWGGLRAVEQMQMVAGYRHAHIYPERIFVPQVHQQLNAEGNLIDAALDGRFSRQVHGFSQFAGLLGKK